MNLVNVYVTAPYISLGIYLVIVVYVEVHSRNIFFFKCDFRINAEKYLDFADFYEWMLKDKTLQQD